MATVPWNNVPSVAKGLSSSESLKRSCIFLLGVTDHKYKVRGFIITSPKKTAKITSVKAVICAPHTLAWG